MRAVTVVEHGRPPVVADHDEPAAADGEVLVEVRAAPITPLDVLCASGTSYFGPPPLPYVPGVQGVGVVRGAGTRVWFTTDAGMRPVAGSMAELVAVAPSEVVALTADVEDTVVAALGLSAVAAWMSLTARARVQPGEQVVVLGAGGTVGQVAVQAAHLLGARRVVAACRSENARESAVRRGADAVVPLSDTDDADTVAERLRAECDGDVDVVIDPLCGVPSTAAARLLGTGGRLVNLGSSAGPSASYDSATLRSRSAELLGYTNNALTPEQRATALAAVLEHAAAGRLAVDHEVVPLADAGAAWQRQAAGTASSRLVVSLS